MESDSPIVRVRANVSTTTKGVYTFDITSEALDIPTMEKNLSEAIKSVQRVMAEKGYKEAGKELSIQ